MKARHTAQRGTVPGNHKEKGEAMHTPTPIITNPTPIITNPSMPLGALELGASLVLPIDDSRLEAGVEAIAYRTAFPYCMPTLGTINCR
jgi:hypothetical protein